MSFHLIDTKSEHASYERMTVDVRCAVDAAYQAAVKVLKASNVETSNDDRAEELVAAIAYYVRRSWR